MGRDDRITVRPCVSCMTMFPGKSWMVRCLECYKTKRNADERLQRATEQGGEPLEERPCDRCGEPYWPRYKLDLWCPNCYREGKELMALKGQTETSEYG